MPAEAHLGDEEGPGQRRKEQEENMAPHCRPVQHAQVPSCRLITPAEQCTSSSQARPPDRAGP
jgi:hypothetical protein